MDVEVLMDWLKDRRASWERFYDQQTKEATKLMAIARIAELDAVIGHIGEQRYVTWGTDPNVHGRWSS